jgi:F-box domain
MAGLPSELWALILDHVSRPDLKSCRLVNRQVLHLASICLFSKVCMKVTYASVRRAAGISENPAFSTYVRSFVYQLDGLHDERYAFRPERPGEYRRWEKTYGHNLAVEQIYSPSEDARAQAEFIHLIGKQSNEAYELQRILAGFSNLAGIELRCTSKACVAMINSGGYHWQPSEYDLQPLTGRLLLILILLAKAPQNSVTSLVCEQLDWDIFERASLTWIPVYPILNQLRFLQLHFSMLDEFTIRRSVDKPNAMVRFLHATGQLETLLLDFGAYDNFDLADGAEALGNAILTAVRWPRLNTLSLAGFIFCENELLEFLRCHSTLRNLRISQICLHGGTVASMILGLQKHLRLDNLSFHGIYDDRIFEDEDSFWNGSCITSGNAKNGPHRPQLPSGAYLLGGENKLPCAGYRSEKWFGGDDSWSICDGMPLEQDLASGDDLNCTATERQQLPSMPYVLN